MNLTTLLSFYPSRIPLLSPNLLFGAILSLSLTAATNSSGATVPPIDNIDSTLQKLAAHAQQAMPEALAPGVHSHIAAVSSVDKKTILGRFDAQDRVLVHIHLDGTATAAAVAHQVTALRGNVIATNTTYRHGVLAAYLPTDQLGNTARIPGIRALTAESKPIFHVGTYTAQSAAILQTSTLNQDGLKGDGMTIGVISDSFNTAYETAYPPATTAAQDVASGDLPVVNVLQDFPDGTDEGRAMCQIVYDEAPHCNIAFATADESELGFAENIMALRTVAGANVIVDDVNYLDEPIFSDGLVAEAVKNVATSTTEPGKPAVYLSAAGNDGNNGYRGTYSNLPDASVRQSGRHGNLRLDVSDPSSPYYLDPSLTAGGWYNWSTTGGTEPATTVEAPGPTDYGYAIFLQWDDLFDADHGVTTSYNFLVFDQYGNYLSYLSSTSNAFSTQEPIQGIGYLALGTNYQIAITRSTQKDPKAGPVPANHHVALYTTLDGASTLTGEYFQPAPLKVPNIVGHAGSEDAIAVAAYAYSWLPGTSYLPELENFTSPGPVTVYFDQNSQRLTTPEVRLKPEVAGTDGLITTFFGLPYYNEPYAFFGTSAAAPSVAGVAALVVQAAGGPGSISPAKVKQVLEASPQPRSSTVEATQAIDASSAGYVTATALGQSYFSPNYITVSFQGVHGGDLEGITIDGTAAGLVFNTQYLVLGTLNGPTPADITLVSPSASTKKFTLKFKPGTFKSGDSIGFTIGQDVTGTYPGYTQGEYGSGVEAEDLASGATFSSQVGGSDPQAVTAPFLSGTPTTAYNPADGYGLVNAVTAVKEVLPSATIPAAKP